MILSHSLLALAGLANAALLQRQVASSTTATPTLSASDVPEYFQLTAELFAGTAQITACELSELTTTGPTSTGVAPFLAETNPAPFGTVSFVANAPLETAEPISGNTNSSIFRLMGNLSPYFPNPEGFGVKEFALPEGANISQFHMLSRHGSRYPTTNSSQFKVGQTIATAKRNGTKFSGALSFLNTWEYSLGAEILVPIGRQESVNPSCIRSDTCRS